MWCRRSCLFLLWNSLTNNENAPIDHNYQRFAVILTMITSVDSDVFPDISVDVSVHSSSSVFFALPGRVVCLRVDVEQLEASPFLLPPRPPHRGHDS